MFKKNDISKTINFIEDIILPTAVHITITIMSQRITHTHTACKTFTKRKHHAHQSTNFQCLTFSQN